MNTFYSLIFSALVLPSSFFVDINPGGTHDRHQAMYLMNLIRNIDWEGDKITIGVVGDSPVTNELEIFVKRNSKIELRTLSDIALVTECNIVFLPNTNNQNFYLVQKEIADSSILLVVDKKELVLRGAEIGFYLENDKLQIAMNPKEIEKTGIKISHSLMEKAASY